MTFQVDDKLFSVFLKEVQYPFKDIANPQAIHHLHRRRPMPFRFVLKDCPIVFNLLNATTAKFPQV